ncbi:MULTISPECIES: hypothetical protein [Providencia]|nr:MULTISPECIES: hypothetical protein [Providencia]EKT59034.1 hypothetical protein OOC_05132 [Providencia rettgeri Dmel1]MBS0917924.1 hypothetical protein [Providencia rettgeri]MCG5281215.1 hypothetical protein [Providencia rettgeri]MDH2365886.1 hypothetical protein [Providencia rettgeri]HEM7133687.1 hypothetical protein [Providencia rettgeri]
MQCSDLEWFYCHNGEVMDANEATEKRFAIFRKIERELKNAHNRSKECLPPTGLDESIYYRCEGDSPSVENALNNPWVKRVEDYGVTSAKGVKRIEDTAVYLGVFPPQIMGMSFLLKSRITRNPRVMQENIEAVYLLRFIHDPYTNFSEVINIIFGEIIKNMTPARKQKLSNYINTVQNLSNINKVSNVVDLPDIRGGIDKSFKNFVIESTPGLLAESTIRKFIVAAIITKIVESIVLKHRSFFKPVRPKTVISRAVIVATVIYSYGTIEKMSEATRRLKNKNRAVYDAMDKSQITMAYYFVEEELGPLITLAASPSNSASDDAFVAEISHLINKYKN